MKLENIKANLKRKKGLTLAEQLYEELRQTILTGQWRPGQPVPSTRQLAQDLGVSRSTVIETYERLITEGYFETKAAYQTLVSNQLPSVPDAAQPRAKLPPAQLERLSRLGRTLAECDLRDKHFPDAEICFYSWRPALSEAPLELWTRTLWRKSRMEDEKLLDHAADKVGEYVLRKAIAEHIAPTSGIKCAPEQVIITVGFYHAMDIVARVHLEPGDRVAVENPGFPDARVPLSVVGVKTVPIAVDESGISVDQIANDEGPPFKLVYCTPSHQYPTGAVLSLARRLNLLEWAKTSGAVIVEDDYDSEYRYSGHPIPALKALDSNECVMQVGSFSKAIFPSIGLGYLIVPKTLAEVYANARRLSCDPVSVHLQVALADFIIEGHLHRHMKRMRQLYNERRIALLRALKKHFRGRATVSGDDAGIHVLVQLQTHLSDDELIKRALKAGVGIMSTSHFYDGDSKEGEFVFGYGNLDEEQIAEGIRRLAEVIKA